MYLTANRAAFVDNKTFFSMDDSHTELELAIRLSENLKKIHYLTTAHYHCFDELILKYLRTGLEIFDLKIGIVSKITGQDYMICNAVSPDGSLKKGDVFPLEGTYCREVSKSGDVMGFPYVGMMDDMKDHPVYLNMKLESYISAPIYLDGTMFGTLNFTSTEPRENGFSEHEKDLIALMANSIASFLMLEEKEAKLVSANERLKRLVGFVAHDLREPLGSINGLSDFLAGADADERKLIASMIETSSGKALEMVSTILEVAAMGTGKIDLRLEQTDLSHLLRNISRTFQSASKNKHQIFDVSIEEGLICKVDPNRIEQVIRNLLSNAVKYAPIESTINLELTRETEGRAYFLIENEMLNETDHKVGKTNSTGFGLEIVREILELHGAPCSIDRIDKRFKVTFSLDLLSR